MPGIRNKIKFLCFFLMLHLDEPKNLQNSFWANVWRSMYSLVGIQIFLFIFSILERVYSFVKIIIFNMVKFLVVFCSVHNRKYILCYIANVYCFIAVNNKLYYSIQWLIVIDMESGMYKNSLHIHIIIWQMMYN